MRGNDEIWTNGIGAIYSDDGKVLLKCPNVRLYRIREGCERVDERAFVGCDQLQSLYVPYTFSDEAFEALMESDATGVSVRTLGLA